MDYQTGALIPLADSPLTAGKNPVTLVPTPDGKNLYVVNQDDSNVMQYSIGTDGKLYLKNTVNVTGSTPTAAAVDPAGKFLYITFTYQLGPGGQQLYSPASPGPGGITIFPIDARPAIWGLLRLKTSGTTPWPSRSARHAKSAAYVYVVDQEPTPAPRCLASLRIRVRAH